MLLVELSLAGDPFLDFTMNCGDSGVSKENCVGSIRSWSREEGPECKPDTLCTWVEIPSMLVTRRGESSSFSKKFVLT